MTKINEVYDGAIKLLTEKGWTQGEGARSANGACVPLNDARAVCFCLLGALSKAADAVEDRVRSSRRYRTARDRLIQVLKGHRDYVGNLITFNDEPGRKVEEVIALLEKAKVT